ncbi:MAG: hypothetical protein COC19_08570 [SAR86 cluster bacterium]|uniref:Uncharacterized protein n=1 Tax=SAR86 cluster bacterium TaxID=2030880 RepID=A0A2A4MER1_9GAMM|nr:MAG: hypothetical protein COC19_08570 [SAR86 cluster bacterium]
MDDSSDSFFSISSAAGAEHCGGHGVGGCGAESYCKNTESAATLSECEDVSLFLVTTRRFGLQVVVNGESSDVRERLVSNKLELG